MLSRQFNYSDIVLFPNLSTVRGRSESDIDISVELCGFRFKAPWIPANMLAVINKEIAHYLSENNYFYIYHRFGNTKQFLMNARQEAWKLISISIGVKKEDYDLIDSIAESKCRVDFITIDIAAGHSVLMKDMIDYLVKKLPNTKIIAGNVATLQGVRDLYKWGADCVKVGIAGGAACSTKNMTGFHVPMFSCVLNCSDKGVILDEEEELPPIIADGGIKENGDIAKALVAGARMVMAGSLFSSCIDAPSERVQIDGKNYKQYFGSASSLNKILTKQENKNVEGLKVLIPETDLTYKQKYAELSQSLRSAVSYAGGNSLSAFKDVDFGFIH